MFKAFNLQLQILRILCFQKILKHCLIEYTFFDYLNIVLFMLKEFFKSFLVTLYMIVASVLQLAAWIHPLF